VTTLAQRATLTLTGVTAPGKGTPTTATFVPARPGRSVVLQWRYAGTTPWTTAASGVETSAGKAPFTINRQEGKYQYRAVALAAKGAASVASPTKNLTVTVTSGRFLVGVSANGRNLLDQQGSEYLVRGDTAWALPFNAGRWGGTWQSDIDAWAETRAKQGYNYIHVNALGSKISGGVSDDGATFDGVLPFVNGQPGTLNPAYWERIDYLLDVFATHGITVQLDIIYSEDVANGALSTSTPAQFTDYGTALANRYQTRPNLVWSVGGDWFDEPGADANTGATLDAITATRDTHLVTIENNQETTSRRTSEGSVLNLGSTYADFQWIYTYNATYLMAESAWNETSPIPVVWGDGTYDGAAANNDRTMMRNLQCWAITSGSQGNNYGAEATWAWPNGALAALTTNTFAATDQPTNWNLLHSLTGWQDLVPDFAGTFITDGRGTKATQFPSGTPDTHYTGGNTYVTGAITPNGTLALLYLPDATRTITLNTDLMGPGYTARWIAPTTGASTPATNGPTYTHPDANAAGSTDWLLVLESSTPR